MKTNPLKQGVLTENSAGIGTVTRKMVRERAVELAVINGRSAQDVSKSDWEQARRELTGEPDTDPKEAVLESAPESERWDPVPDSEGRRVPVAPSPSSAVRRTVVLICSPQARPWASRGMITSSRRSAAGKRPSPRPMRRSILPGSWPGWRWRVAWVLSS